MYDPNMLNNGKKRGIIVIASHLNFISKLHASFGCNCKIRAKQIMSRMKAKNVDSWNEESGDLHPIYLQDSLYIKGRIIEKAMLILDTKRNLPQIFFSLIFKALSINAPGRIKIIIAADNCRNIYIFKLIET